MDKIEPLHGLVEFVAAADAGSFSAAARRSASRSPMSAGGWPNSNAGSGFS